jgi:acyl carrier protein
MTGISEAANDRRRILGEVVALIEEMARDWEVGFSGGIQQESRLIADLGFQSVDVVQFIVALEEHYGRRNLPFAELLMKGGRFVDDLSVGETVEFLVRQLSANGAAGAHSSHAVNGHMNGKPAAG